MILLVTGTGGALFAQYEQDALSYGRTYIGGSARSMSMAGAQQATGGDMGNFVGNPAGLAFYRRGDMNISPGLHFNSTESSYLGNQSTDGRDAIKIGSIGIVFAAPNIDYKGNEKSSGWVSWAFGFGMNKINNFSEQFTIQGRNNNNSLNTSFLEAANSDGVDNTTYQYLAYDAFLLDTVPGSNPTQYIGLAANGGGFQQERRTRKGSQTQWSTGGGGNYNNKLYWGAELNIMSLNYSSLAEYSESDINDTTYTYAIKSFELQDKLEQSGLGINLKTGIIVRPTDLVRFGVSVQTPTYYRIEETTTAYLMSVDVNNNKFYGNAGEDLTQNFSYGLTTPSKLEAGMALFFGKLGMITADVEHLDYGAALFSSNSSASFDLGTNTSIRNAYKSTENYRFGAEVKLGDISVRMGYALYGNPYTYVTTTNRYVPFYTGGIGWKTDGYYLDFGLVNTQRQFSYRPYTLNDGSEPKSSIISSTTSFLMTIGTRF